MKMNKKMSNQEIARLLKGMAAAYQLKSNQQFRIRAYETAAASVEHATSTVKDLWDDGKLEMLPGIGKSIASHLDELFRTGKVKHFEEVMNKLPPSMFEFLEIPGVGAKTAYKLAKKLKIISADKALENLKKAAEAGKIRQIEGFGEESEREILEELNKIGEKGEERLRMTLPFAGELAKDIIAYMKKCPHIARIDPLGSLRRRVATVGDLDFGVATNKPEVVIKHFCKYPKTKEVVAAGGNTARIITHDNRQIDLKTQSQDAYGSLLQHYTGSKQHNIHLREIAQKRGWSLSEYGIKMGEKSVKKFKTEEDFYHELEMDWIPPELREDSGEIESALLPPIRRDQGLPKLIELKEVKGDLHIHSNINVEPSHDLGSASIEEIAKKANEKNYEYVGLSEHNPSVSQHSDRQILDIIKRKRVIIDKFNYSNKKNTRIIHLLNGLEIDIKPNGELAIPEQGLKYLDFAIVSIHSSFRQSRKIATDRVLKALSYPKVAILGHPTGRMLNQREGMEFDWELIFNFCQKYKKLLEISAWPNRLDLPDTLVREAIKYGVRMVINSDAHQLSEMDLMEYGVSVARRGWAERKDIFNTLTYDKILKELKGGDK